MLGPRPVPRRTRCARGPPRGSPAPGSASAAATAAASAGASVAAEPRRRCPAPSTYGRVARLLGEHDRQPARHRLLRGDGEPFAARGQEERVGGAIELRGDALGVTRPEQLDVVGQRRRRVARADDRELPRPVRRAHARRAPASSPFLATSRPTNRTRGRSSQPSPARSCARSSARRRPVALRRRRRWGCATSRARGASARSSASTLSFSTTMPSAFRAVARPSVANAAALRACRARRDVVLRRGRRARSRPGRAAPRARRASQSARADARRGRRGRARRRPRAISRRSTRDERAARTPDTGRRAAAPRR